jgi:hypothetical protein
MKITLNRIVRTHIKFIFYFIFLSANGLEFDIILDAGLQTGTVQEMAYEGNKMISRLDWNDILLPTSGITGILGLNNIFLKMGIKFAVPVKGGIMEDYDYCVAFGLIPRSLLRFKERLYLKDGQINT